MDAQRRTGLLLGGVALAALAALLFIWPLPGNAFELAAGSADSAIVRAPGLVHFDQANDTTLAVFGWCDHQPCGDAFVFRGDARERLKESPYRLVPAEGERGREPADVDLNTRTGTRHPYGDPERAAGAMTVRPEMTIAYAWTPLLAYAVALAGAFAGAGLATRARWASALPPLALASTGLGIPMGGGLGAVLAGVAGVLVALIAAGVALALGRRRFARTLALVAAALVAGIWLGTASLPLGSGEI